VSGSEAHCEPKGAKPLVVAPGSAVNGAQDTLRDRGQPKPAWYAVWTRSHCERSVAQQLIAKGFETFVPEIAAWSRRGGAAHLIQVPIFPGYLFVRTGIDRQRYVEMLKARGLVRVLGEGWDRLAAIPDREIDAIHRVVQARVAVAPHAYLTGGDRVTVIDGPLTGIEGIFVQDRQQKGRLVLSVELLGRSVAVDVDRAAVIPVSYAIAS
jgi:transcription antitermination factor NusG